MKSKPRKYKKVLKDKTIALIFSKASTRTRVSFEVGIYQLGGTPIFLSSHDMQLGRGEEMRDTARVLERYIDGIVIRTYEQAEIEKLATCCDIPIINGLTNQYHPCQALSDLLTISKRFKKLDAIKICYLGDGNNMAHSLAWLCDTLGITLNIATPKDYPCDPEALRDLGTNYVHFTNDPSLASKDAHVLYTDVWTSMGQEGQASKKNVAFKDFQINREKELLADKDCVIMHCLPAYKGLEISEESFESPKSIVFDQAENRLYMQKAILTYLFGRL